jgi:hypothetical protein
LRMELAALDHGDHRGMRKVAASLIKEALRATSPRRRRLPIVSMVRYGTMRMRGVWVISAKQQPKDVRVAVLRIDQTGQDNLVVNLPCGEEVIKWTTM